MKRLVVVTSTRAEYGLLSPIIKKLNGFDDIEVKVVVTGSHLSSEFGMTVREIENDGVEIDKRIEILLSSDTHVSVSKAMGLALISFSEYFDSLNPNAIMILGDRFESLAIGIAAMNARIPIIHLHGGEATEGLIDEAVRNSLTKLSYLHFTSTESYRDRVIQMGEDPLRVFNVGAVGVENVLKMEIMNKDDIKEYYGDNFNKLAVLTFHPVTLEDKTAERQILELLEAIVKYKDIMFICTKANADMNGRIINQHIEKYGSRYSNVKLYDSLGMKKYLSLVKYAEFVIGNSSSGIIEVPSFKIPTINIGDRQKGRIQAQSIINCSPKKEDIVRAIELAMSEKFRKSLEFMKNPYENGCTTDKIAMITRDYLINNKLKIQKKFYDILYRG